MKSIPAVLAAGLLISSCRQPPLDTTPLDIDAGATIALTIPVAGCW